MTTRIYFATNILGEVAEKDLQKALDHFNLGTLIHYRRTAEGVMGQTLHIHTSQGEFILKGNPLYKGQLQEEQFFVEQLAEHTTVPVPIPYQAHEETDLLGWSYAIMPELPGQHLHDLTLQAALAPDEEWQIASMLAYTLAELHHWKVPNAGEYDPVAERIVPFAGTYSDWLYGTIHYWLQDATQYSRITDEDIDWVDEQLSQARSAFESMSVYSFVMGDYKSENLVMEKQQQAPYEWQISGLFDFTTSYFGDGTADLTKITAMYLRHRKPELAQSFLCTYRELICAEDVKRCQHFAERLRIHLLYQRILVWGEAKATQQVTWDADLPFATWAQQYIDSVIALLD